MITLRPEDYLGDAREDHESEPRPEGAERCSPPRITCPDQERANNNSCSCRTGRSGGRGYHPVQLPDGNRLDRDAQLDRLCNTVV